MDRPADPAADAHPWADLALSLGLVGLLFVFWDSSLVVPLKVLVVFFHEASHALMTLATGGEVLHLKLFPGQGGEVLSRGGNRFLILSAGYLGSLVIGGALLVLAARTRLDRWLNAALGLAILLLAAFYIRQWFGALFALAAAAFFLAAARWLPLRANDLLLRTVGLTSIGYVPLDIYSDTLARPHLYSDARMLAMEFGGTTQFWGLVWLVISVVVAALCLWLSWPRARPARS